MTSAAEVSSLAGALVEANDRLLGLIELTGVAVDSLDANEQITRILNVALGLLPADAATLTGAATLHVGAADSSWAHTMQAEAFVDDDTSIELTMHRNVEPFGTPEHKIAQAVANLVARAARIAALHANEVNRAVLVRDHGAAAALAQGMIPPPGSEPVVEGVALHARTEPARLAGGDLYVWGAHGDRLGFAVGDVSGKGLPAAVMMATVASATQNALRRFSQDGAEECMSAIHRWVSRQLSDAGMFVTLCVGLWTPGTGEIEMVNAGHSPIVLVTADGTQRIPASAPPIGVLDTLEAEVWTRTPAHEEVLVIGSDGLTEQEDPDGVAVGEDAFDQLVAEKAACTNDATDLANALFNHVAEHAVDADQSDDRTAMIIRFRSGDEQS